MCILLGKGKSYRSVNSLMYDNFPDLKIYKHFAFSLYSVKFFEKAAVFWKLLPLHFWVHIEQSEKWDSVAIFWAFTVQMLWKQSFDPPGSLCKLREGKTTDRLLSFLFCSILSLFGHLVSTDWNTKSKVLWKPTVTEILTIIINEAILSPFSHNHYIFIGIYARITALFL